MRIDIAVGRKIHCCELAFEFGEVLDKLEFGQFAHVAPYLNKLSSRGRFQDDILGSNRI